MTSPITTTIAEHWLEIIVAVSLAIMVGFAALAAVIVFIRWIAHTEVARLTAALHSEMAAIAARIDQLIRRKWTDDALSEKFANIGTVLNSHEDALDDILDEHRRFHGEAGAPRDQKGQT